jgi:hypothetical protein
MRLWIALGIAGLLAIGAAVAGIGLACSSLIGGASDQLGRGLEIAQDELQREQRRTAITQRQYQAVRLDTPRAAVENRLGRPVAGGDAPQGRTGAPAGSTCIHYHELGQPLFAGPTYRFCFRSGRLIAKDVL